jgi:hypothetical protein
MARTNNPDAPPVAGDQNLETGDQAGADPIIKDEASDLQPPSPPEPPVENGKESAKKKIKNKSCAGVSLVAATGVKVEFDKDGVAECLKADYEHLIGIPGYEAVK